MSFLGKLFGAGKNPEKAPTPAEAIQGLRQIEEMLGKKVDYLEKRVDEELTVAKKNGVKNKRIALQALKKKKRFEQQLRQIDGTLTTIEFQRESLENANTNTEVLKVMGFAAKALKGAHANMDVDEVHDLMDDIKEQQEISNEILEAISNPVGFGQEVDEDELMKELEDLAQEEIEEDLLKVPDAVNLPNVPTAEPSHPSRAKSKQDEEDDDMKELAAWAQ